MKNTCFQALALIFLFLFFGCKPEPHKRAPESLSNSNNHPNEIITSSYSVKLAAGNIVKDTVNMIQSYTYDSSGKELANIYYNLDGSIGWKDVYQYNDKGHKIGSKFYDKGESLTSYYLYNIDSLGRRVYYKALDINTDTLLYDGASQYMDDGKIRRDGYINKTGSFKWNFEYQFDEAGNELGYTYINLQTKEEYPTIYKIIKRDKQGRWLERQLIENNQTVGIEVRQMEIR